MISRNLHDPIRPAAQFSKTFVKAAAFGEKVRLRCLKISKNSETRHQTFEKYVREDCRIFGKESGYDPGTQGEIRPLPGVPVQLTPYP